MNIAELEHGRYGTTDKSGAYEWIGRRITTTFGKLGATPEPQRKKTLNLRARRSDIRVKRILLSG